MKVLCEMGAGSVRCVLASPDVAGAQHDTAEGLTELSSYSKPLLRSVLVAVKRWDSSFECRIDDDSDEDSDSDNDAAAHQPKQTASTAPSAIPTLAVPSISRAVMCSIARRLQLQHTAVAHPCSSSVEAQETIAIDTHDPDALSS